MSAALLNKLTLEEEEVPDLLDLDEQPIDKRVPITVLTGALGSGKSTLLQYILTAQHNRRIAVIVNEFGDTSDIESRNLQLADSGALYDEVLELKNGCLCCTTKDIGIAAIENLMKRKGDFDAVLLETTGLADPVSIIQSFWQDDELSRDLYLDGLVCIVDALHIDKQLYRSEDAEQAEISIRQVACADVLLVSKTDLLEGQADASSLAALQATLSNINASAPLHPVHKGVVDLSLVLDLDAYAAGSKPFHAPPSLPATSHTSRHAGISSLTIPLPVFEDVASGSRFDAVLRSLLWEGRLPGSTMQGVDVLRTKALVHTTSDSFVLQGVQEIYELKPISPCPGQEGKLVFIGHGLSEELKESFVRALHDVPPT